MKISLVIPTYTLTKELERLALWAAASYREQVDQLIITEDGGMYSPKLQEISDIYIYNKVNVGFSKNVNRGWKNADGDFIMIVNSDTQLMKGKLDDLCIPGMVTSPEIVNQYIDRLAGPFWCTPKELTDRFGYLREEMRTYSSDSEYDERMKDFFTKVPSVQVFHEQAKTVTEAGVEGGEEQEKDRKIYADLIAKGEVK